ncbi:hypothetical protein MD484_g3237, partial [Candolleomyces efflorescens]
MTSTALTHSPHVYDRAPIRVSPNNCALPDRGERVYSDDGHCGSPLSKECYFMLPPRRLETMQPSSSLLFNNSGAVNPGVPSHDRYDIASPPLLGSDVSSESEDSDQCKSPPDPSTPRIPFVSVQLANATAPYPFGGGFAREPSVRGIPGDLAALPFPLHHKAKKKSISEGVEATVIEGAGTPLKKRVKKDSEGSGSNGGSGSSTFLQNYLTFLNSSGYTSLSSAIQQVQHNGNVSSDWLDDLSSGNWTVFVPTNQAFDNLTSDITNNATALNAYLSYHNVYGNAVNSTSGNGGGGGSSSSSTTSSSSTSTSESTSSSATASAYRLSKIFLKPYHFQTDDDSEGDTGVFPNDTIGRTLLTDPDYVQLEGNGSRAQVLAWAMETPGGDINILNQASNTTVGNTTQWGNLLLAQIDNVLTPPGNVSEALQAVNDTPLMNLANSIQVPFYGNSSSGGGAGGGSSSTSSSASSSTGSQSTSASASATSSAGGGGGGVGGGGSSGGFTNITALQALEGLQGFTLFAPSADAFSSDVNNTIQALQSNNNQAALLALLQNHYVNGSTFYGPTLRELAFNASSGDSSANSTVVSAAGQYFGFYSNSTGLFVSNGNGTEAQVTRPDVLVENGVIHIIDRVLVNEGSNPSAASSAYSSFSMEATQTSTDTSVMGDLPIPTESTASFTQSQSGSGGGGGASSTSESAGSSTQSSSSTSSSTQSSSTSSETASVTTQGGFRFDRRNL